MYIAKPKVIGFHGTYPKNTDSILDNNFYETVNHDIWLGDGVYFFIEGIGAHSPKDYAAQFAKDQALQKGKYIYSEYCVLEATIRIDEKKLLDLTDTLGGRLFNEFREKAIKMIVGAGKGIATEKYRDSDVLKVMRNTLGIEFVKANVYISFDIQRIRRFASRIPNVTILTVNNPVKNIQRQSIKEILKGNIS